MKYLNRIFKKKSKELGLSVKQLKSIILYDKCIKVLYNKKDLVRIDVKYDNNDEETLSKINEIEKMAKKLKVSVDSIITVLALDYIDESEKKKSKV